MKRLPCAHSTIISEKAFPTPVVVTTLMMIPTATNNRAVDTMVFTPSTTASNISGSRMGVEEIQDAPITLIMAKAADVVGVQPATRKLTKTIIGIIKCQPSFNTSETFSVSSFRVSVSPRRLASIRTK